jgi:hypothetical protein
MSLTVTRKINTEKSFNGKICKTKLKLDEMTI